MASQVQRGETLRKVKSQKIGEFLSVDSKLQVIVLNGDILPTVSSVQVPGLRPRRKIASLPGRFVTLPIPDSLEGDLLPPDDMNPGTIPVSSEEKDSSPRLSKLVSMNDGSPRLSKPVSMSGGSPRLSKSVSMVSGSPRLSKSVSMSGGSPRLSKSVSMSGGPPQPIVTPRSNVSFRLSNHRTVPSRVQEGSSTPASRDSNTPAAGSPGSPNFDNPSVERKSTSPRLKGNASMRSTNAPSTPTDEADAKDNRQRVSISPRLSTLSKINLQIVIGAGDVASDVVSQPRVLTLEERVGEKIDYISAAYSSMFHLYAWAIMSDSERKTSTDRPTVSYEETVTSIRDLVNWTEFASKKKYFTSTAEEKNYIRPLYMKILTLLMVHASIATGCDMNDVMHWHGQNVGYRIGNVVWTLAELQAAIDGEQDMKEV